MTAILAEMISDSTQKQLYDQEFLIWGEYGGELLGARPFELTRKSLEKLYDLHKQHDSLFSDLIEHTFERWASYTVSCARFFVEVIDIPTREHVGFLYLTDLMQNENEPCQVVSAYGHFSFWSGRLGERRKLVKELLELFAESFEMHKLYVRLPVYAPGAIRAAVKLGFTGPFKYRLRDRDIQVEAQLREAIKYKGEWRDVIIMSLVGDELWDHQSKQAQEKSLKRT